jgi:hypothetical protein
LINQRLKSEQKIKPLINPFNEHIHKTLLGDLLSEPSTRNPSLQPPLINTSRKISTMPKANSAAAKGKAPRHTPLHVEISKDSDMQKFGRVASTGDKKKKGKKRAGAEDDEDDAEGSKEGGVVGGRMSRKILDLARDQQEEVMGEMDDDDEDEEWEEDEEDADEKVVGTGQRIRKPDEDEDEDLDEGDVSEEEYAELVSRGH